MNIFFTADTHFGHDRIIQYCKRPFKGHQEMDEAMLLRFNEVLRPGDLLYHLGDVAFSSFDMDKGFLSRLLTKEVHLILGNHDKPARMQLASFRSVQEEKHINIGGQSVILFHYAMRSWRNQDRGSIQLYGHSHGKLPGIGRQMDVGVDTHDFYPWEWSEIKARLGQVAIRERQ